MPEPLRALLVDDERLARRALRSTLAATDDVTVAVEARGVDDALQALADAARAGAPIDVVFLDIQLRGETGFDFLDRLDRPVQVVFVTAFDRYAVRAFEVNALDYLLKPVEPERLADALTRLRRADARVPRTAEVGAHDGFRYDDLFFYEESRRPRFIRIRDVLYVEAAGNYTELHLEGGDAALTSTTLADWADRLPDDHFARIHRSCVVHLDRITHLTPQASGTYAVHVEGVADPLPLSRRRAAALKARLNAPLKG